MPFDTPRGRQQIVGTDSVPAPVGGLNFRDSAAAMPVTDAILMLNFQPLPYAVALRKGWQEVVTGLGATVETISNHHKADGTQVIIMAAGPNIFAQTAPGPVGVAAVSGLTDAYWQTTMLSNSGGTFTYMVNGADAPQVYNGTAFAAVALQDPPTGFNVKGLDPKLFLNITLHQRRLWFVEKNSLRMWYLPPDQIGGVLEEFDLGPVMGLGGTLVTMASWTVDAGQGMDDYAAFISSEGQVAIYVGSDPGSITTWTLQGVFSVGSPIGLRCATKYGGDVIVITRDGLLPLSKALQSTRVNSQVNLTDKIQHLISSLISAFGEARGWETFLFPNENQVWVTVPTPDAVRVFSMNTISGAWCEYAGMSIASVCLYDDQPLFGTRDGRVGLGWTGYLDGVTLATGEGTEIAASVVTAYNYFGEPGRNKRWVLARPIFQSGSVPASSIGVLLDFEYTGTPELVSQNTAPSVQTQAFGAQPLTPGTFGAGPSVTPFATAASSQWNAAVWNGSNWPESSSRYRNWVSISGIGYCAALSIDVVQGNELLWTATDFVFEMGSVV